MRNLRSACTGMLLVLCAATACTTHGSVETSPDVPAAPPTLVDLLGDTPALLALDGDEPARRRWEEKQVGRLYAKLTASPAASPAATGDAASSAAPAVSPSRPRGVQAAYVTAAPDEARRTVVTAPTSRETTTRTSETRTRDSSAGPVTTTIESDATIGGGEITTTTRKTSAVGDKAASAAGTQSTTTLTAVSCPAEGEARGEWSSEKTIEQTTKGTTVRITVRGHGTYVAAGEGRMSMPEFVMVVSVGPEGAAEATDRAAGSVGPWQTGGTNDLLKGITFESGEGKDAGDFAAYLLYQVQLELELAERDARERRDSGGLCVDLSAQADKTTLASGEEATVTVTVVDTETGEAVPDAVVEASAVDGTVSASSVQAPGAVRFTADGGDAPQVYLSVSTPRGGDAARVRFDIPGWSFEGLSYDQVTASEGVPVTFTWSAKVCGDPFTAPWHATTKLVSPVRNFDLAGDFQAVDVKQAPTSDGTSILIERAEPPRDGDPPFRLWVDDRDPAAVPNHVRVEVTNLRPVTGACAAG